MSTVYTIRCDAFGCIEIFNPLGVEVQHITPATCREAARVRGWTKNTRKGVLYDACPGCAKDVNKLLTLGLK